MCYRFFIVIAFLLLLLKGFGRDIMAEFTLAPSFIELHILEVAEKTGHLGNLEMSF